MGERIKCADNQRKDEDREKGRNEKRIMERIKGRGRATEGHIVLLVFARRRQILKE